MRGLGGLLGWKFDNAEGIETRNGVITAWPAGLGGTDMPTAGQITTWTAEYDAIANDIKRDRIWSWITSDASDAIVMRAVVTWIAEKQDPSMTLSEAASEIKPIIKSML